MSSIPFGETWSEILSFISCISALFSMRYLVPFNLIPAFPSDGGRILRSALVRRKKDYNEATKSAVNIGIAILYTFMAFGFITLLSDEIIGGIWVLLLSWFLRSGAESYLAQIRLTSILSRTYLRDIMNINIISVKPDLTK